MSLCKPILALAAAALCFGAAAQPAVSADAAASAKARYQQERAACEKSTSKRDKADCLREAGAAYNEARHGRLSTSAELEANATARCKAVPEADREDCHSRVLNRSNTTSSGTVEDGAVLKQTTTRYVKTPEGDKPIKE